MNQQIFCFPILNFLKEKIILLMIHSCYSNSIFSRYHSSITSHTIRFLLNGQVVELEEGKFDPTDSLVTFLRSDEINMKGTKRGCEEGGCGACTVIMSSYDPVFNRVKHRAINSCLMPIGNLHNTSISTIERLTDFANSNSIPMSKLNPIQEAIKKHHATQCGYCSPGFIMSMLAILLENPTPTNEDLMQRLDGNICRCTGYRSILEALREFTVDLDPNDQIISQRIKSNQKNSQFSNEQMKKSLNQEIVESLKSLSDFSLLKQNTASENEFHYTSISNGCDLPKQPISIRYNEHFYFLPSSLNELIDLKKQHPKAKIIVGNTELLASSSPNDKFDYISTNMIDELKFIKIDKDQATGNKILRIGASTTIDDVFEFCLKDKTENRVFRALKNRIAVFASNQTRSVACITGNIASAGASTDFTNFLPGVDATLKVIDAATRKARLVKFDNFFLGRFKTILKETDVITEIFFNIDSLLLPGKRKDASEKVNTDHCFVYKISNRREICGCALSSTIRADISESPESSDIINDIKISFSKLSGVNPIGRAKKAEKFLIGKKFTLENIQKAFQFIDIEFPISDDLDDGLDKYRRELAHNVLLKFYHQTQKERGKTGQYDESIVNSSYDSTTFSFTDSNNKTETFTLSDKHIPEFSVSCQCNEDGTTVPLSRLKGPNSVGKSVPHLSASLQVQGKAEYTDDIPLDKRAKHAAFVTSTIAHGRIKRINFQTEELKKKKFSFFTSHDMIEGANHLNKTEEEFLASKEVSYYGQPIAIVVADSEREAWRIAKMVEVEYEELPVIASIEEAIENGKSFQGPSLKHGENVEEIFKKFENSPQRSNIKIINGSVKMGGQYHIYLEPNSSVVSHTSDGQYTIRPTCKNLDNARDDAAKNLNVDQNHVYVNVKRLGGSFCSKSTRATIVSTACAIASQKLNCQVKMRLPRDIDTHIMSGDHAFLNKYKVCFDSSTGKIIALKMDFYVDAGFWYQTTSGLVIKAILHSDSCYKIPNVEVNSYLCQTNKISSAHFRGFGFQNGNLSIEGVVERVSRYIQDEVEKQKSNVNLDPDEIKKVNFYKTNDKTNYGVTLDDVNIDKCWSLIKEKSRYEELRRCARAFNIISKNKKRGIAITPLQYGVGQPNAAKRRGSCLVHLLKDGTVLISHSGVEAGQGLNTKLCCIAAKILEIPVDSIRIEQTDTSINTEASSTGAGFTNDLTGFAVIDACEQLKSRIKQFYYVDGDLNKRRTFSEVVNLAFLNKVDLTAHGFYASPQEGFDFEKKTGRPYQYYEYGAGVALVEIDILTGEQKVLESHIVFDAGQSLNPGIDIGQIEGGFMQGLGWMMTEETKYVHNSKSPLKSNSIAGKPVNDTMYKYKVPALSNVPLKFSAHLLPDSHNKIGVISSKGVGEPPGILAQCVGFALIDAIEAGRKDNGKGRLSHYDFPLTPDKVKFYLDQQ